MGNDRDKIELLEHYRPPKNDNGIDKNVEAKNKFIAYRSCSKDIMLAAWAARCLRRKGLVYEVALFLAEDHWLFEEDSCIKAGLMMMLAHAYRLSGTMEVSFCGAKPGETPTPETGYESKIPTKIWSFARKLGVKLPEKHKITDDQGRELFIKITNLPNLVRSTLQKHSIDEVLLSFLIHRGVWSLEEVENICRWSAYPELVLTGNIYPEERMLFQNELLILEVGLLARRMRDLLKVEDEGQERIINFIWDSKCFGKAIFHSSESFILTPLFGNPIQIEARSPIDVFLIPRNSFQYDLFCQDDLFPGRTENLTIVAVLLDFEWAKKAQAFAQSILEKHNIFVCEVMDTLIETDIELHSCLKQSQNYLQVIEDQPDE